MHDVSALGIALLFKFVQIDVHSHACGLFYKLNAQASRVSVNNVPYAYVI
jgi:hypothetical protein